MQWAIYRELNPFFDGKFIADSYGCRDEKGALRAADRLQYWLCQVSRRPEPYYYLKLDISKFFYRVNHADLLRILGRSINDREMMQLLERAINCEHTPFGLPAFTDPEDCPRESRLFDTGMPIGNLTSQMFANIYLNEIDQYVKNEMHIHFYIRYMDDIIILHKSKEYLHSVKDEIESQLKAQLHLDLNKKTAIRPISMGVEFVGYQIYSTHRRLKKKSKIKMVKRLQFMRECYKCGEIDARTLRATEESYKGLLEHFNGYGLAKSLGLQPEPQSGKKADAMKKYSS